MVDFTYSVIHIPFDPSGSNTDITNLVTGIPRITDTGLDVINTAEIELFVPGGELLTAEPILKEYDKFAIQITDGGERVYYNQFAYAPQEDAMVVTESKQGGTQIKLKLLGLEYNLQSIMYSAPHRWQSGDEVARAIIELYNTSRGKWQPEAVYHGFLPTKTRNTYPFDDAPESCWDRLSDVAKSFGAPPADGGLLDFYTFECTTHVDNKLHIVFRSLGDNDRARGGGRTFSIGKKDTPTLASAVLAGDDETRDFGISPAKANRIIGIFNNSTGSLPVAYSRFVGRDLRWEFLPPHDPTESYIAGEEVRVAGSENVYRARKAVDPNTELTDGDAWEVISRQAYVDTEQYSPWTDDKRQLWQNCGTQGRSLVVGGSRFSLFGNSMPDFNMAVKNNPEYERYPVDVIIAGGTGLTGVDFLLPKNKKPYRGFRVLLAGPTVHESFGNVRGNTIIEYDGSKWFEKYTFDDTNIGAAAVSTVFGFVRKWDGTAWQFLVQNKNPYPFIGGIFISDYDFLHPYEFIENVPGVYRTTGPSANSAVQINYTLPSGIVSFRQALMGDGTFLNAPYTLPTGGTGLGTLIILTGIMRERAFVSRFHSPQRRLVELKRISATCMER